MTPVEVCLHCEAPIDCSDPRVSVGDHAIHGDCADDIPDELVNQQKPARYITTMQLVDLGLATNNELVSTAHDLVSQAVGMEFAQGRSRRSLAASAIYAAIRTHNLWVTQEDVIEATGVSGPTIRAIYPQILDNCLTESTTRGSNATTIKQETRNQ